MPQMMPMMWIFLFTIFLGLMIILIILIYFFYESINPYISSNDNIMSKWIWKW